MTDAAALAAWLAAGDAGAAQALAEARLALAASPGDPLAAAVALRRRLPGLDPQRAAAALEQAELGRLARTRYGIEDPLLLTRDGLEAGTRPEVAARRARLLVAAGVRRVVDLTAGLGLDARAFCAAGLALTAVERDPGIAALLARNCPAARVVTGDATDPAVLAEVLGDLAVTDAVFVDPARRDPAAPRDRTTGRARPERDPERWSPPWSFVARIPHPRVVAKVSPGFTPPPPWAAEWVSVDRTVVECAVYSWPALDAPRQAVVLAGSGTTVIAADDAPAPLAAALDAWVHEPDPAVLRAGAVAGLAQAEGLATVDPASTWLTGPRASTSPALRSHLVLEQLTGSRRQQRRRLADRGVRRATVKSRDADVEPRAVLRELGLAEGPEHVIVLTRRAGQPVALLTEPAAARPR